MESYCTRPVSCQVPYVPFYFVRHGETDHNKRRLLTGQLDIPLNDIGISQARAAGEALQKVRAEIGCVYHSPLGRAMHTAELINESLRRPLFCSPGLIERAMGKHEGLPIERIDITRAGPADGAETFEMFQMRILKDISTILCACTAEKMHIPVVVAHAGVFRALAEGLCPERSSSEVRVPNAAPLFFQPPCLGSNGYFWKIIAN